jgi:hypothetical protein
MNSTNDTCDRYWDDASWLPPWYILDHWCQQDARCRHAKQQALLSACERGDVHYRRSDGKTFDDPVHELSARGLLLIERESFDAWATKLDGKSPLPQSSQPPTLPPRPVWADDSWVSPPKPSRPDTSPTSACATESDAVSTDDDETDAADSPFRMTAEVPSVPSSAIIDAFRIKDDDAENTAWWDQRMRDAKRYGLVDARTAKGRLRSPSYWRPDMIAIWLVDRGHLSTKTAKHIVLHHFPDWTDNLDYIGN